MGIVCCLLLLIMQQPGGVYLYIFVFGREVMDLLFHVIHDDYVVMEKVYWMMPTMLEIVKFYEHPLEMRMQQLPAWAAGIAGGAVGYAYFRSSV